MKIVLASRAPFVAGAEIAGERLATELLSQGHNVTVIVGTEGEASNRFREKGIPCIFSPISFLGDGLGLRYMYLRRSLTKILQKLKPDIVHSNDLPTHQITSDAARRLGLPATCHHRWIYDRKEAVDWFNKFGAAQHIYVSEATQRALQESSESLSKQPGLVIHDGIPIDKCPTSEEKNNAKVELKLSKQKLTIGFVGQISEHKGVKDLIIAWSLLLKKRPEFKERCEFVIVGDDLKNQGQYLREVKSMASQYHLNIRFTGYQADSQRCFRAFDITVVPSHNEPFGLVTTEAMAEKSAVIGCQVGGIAEILSHGQNGLLVEPHSPYQLASSIELLVEDQDMRRRLACNGRETCVQKFSTRRNAERVAQVLREVAERNYSRTSATTPTQNLPPAMNEV